MQVPLYNKNFEKTGEFQTALNLSPDAVQAPVVHQVVKSLLANRRQGTVAVKTKGKVQGGGKKPFKQKGTGRARQGSSRSPLMPGGGTAHGPLPRSYEQKINKKVMLKALHSIVADKFQSGKLIVLETIPSTGKTKDLHQELAAKGLLKGLLVVNSSESLVIRAGRNIPTLKALPVGGLSVYEAVKYEHLIMEKSAFLELEKRLQRELGI